MDLYSQVVDEPIEHDVNEKEEANNGETNGKEILAASSVTDDRLLRRAKRPSKYLMNKQTKEGSSSPNSSNGLADGGPVVNGTRTAKNLRRPRNGYGRGLPKKGIFTSHLLSFIYLDMYRGCPCLNRLPNRIGSRHRTIVSPPRSFSPYFLFIY